jgi:hypothetical protein
VRARREDAVLAIVLVVAAYDVVTGVRLLTSPAPWLVNGSDTLWARATPLVEGGEPARLVASMYARLGAFSLHAGVGTAVWAALGRRHRPALTALLVTYLVTGLAFFRGDTTYFQGTNYFVLKQIFGALWVIALILHFWPSRRYKSS